MGIKVGQGIPEWAFKPPDGWGTNPALAFTRWEPDLTRIPEPLRKAYEAKRASRA